MTILDIARKEIMKNLSTLEWGLISHLGRNDHKLSQADGYHSYQRYLRKKDQLVSYFSI